MKRILPLAAVLLAALACDTPVDPGTAMPGVQIGSEGLIDSCATEASDGEQTLPGFTRTNDEVAADVLGGWMLSGPTVSGTIAFARVDYRAVVESEDCQAALLIGAVGDLDAEPQLSGLLTGNVLMNANGSGALIVSSPTTDGDLRPNEEVDSREQVDLVFEADIDATGFRGDLYWLGCNGTDCITDSIEAVTGSR